jgi:hypothetical protein
MTTAMVRCTQPGCDGTIHDGYCTTFSAVSDELPGELAPKLALAGVPNTSSYHAEAQIAAVRILVSGDGEARRIELVDMANAIRPRTLT